MPEPGSWMDVKPLKLSTLCFGVSGDNFVAVVEAYAEAREILEVAD